LVLIPASDIKSHFTALTKSRQPPKWLEGQLLDIIRIEAPHGGVHQDTSAEYDLSMLKKMIVVAFGFFPVVPVTAQSPSGSTFDARIGSSSIVREDIFAGYLAHDHERQLRGEKNVEILLAERPKDRARLLAWKAWIALNRAVDAYESKRMSEFERDYQRSLELFSDAANLQPDDAGVLAITAAGLVTFSDRLPERVRRDAWNSAYNAYTNLWRVQEADFDNLALHSRGELLAGLAQAAQRSAHPSESAQALEQIITRMSGTTYAGMAKKWVDSPETAAKTNLTCRTCHEEGRLESRKAALNQSK
jgi:hypothetical protein